MSSQQTALGSTDSSPGMAAPSSCAELIVGISGARRNAAAAVAAQGRLIAACEQERITRARGVGIASAGLPIDAVETILRIAGRTARDVTTYAAGEPDIAFPAGWPHLRLDHHYAHAATAFHSSPFDEAIIVVCDRHSDPEVTVWRGTGPDIVATQWRWEGPGFASLYDAAVEAGGLTVDRDEHRLEALGRLGADDNDDDDDDDGSACAREGASFTIPPDWAIRLRQESGLDAQPRSLTAAARFARRVHRHLGAALREVLRGIRKRFACPHLCLAGGFFYNTYFTTLVRQSGLYARTFVPVNPGNAGLAVGIALASARQARAPSSPPVALSPFLGPAYSAEEIKAVLDNCKLSYVYANERQILEQTVDALRRSELVGWFHGRMEWGPRALGNRSILASPISPYVLENLNAFLKGREPYRVYGVSVCEEDLARDFNGPCSPFMEHEHEIRDPERFRHIMPVPHGRLRVQTVGDDPPQLRRLLKAFGAATGVPVLVNTSFNGFREPIVCTPRDAVRVFYGTGLDMLVIGNFIIRK
jgi:carbamoyltransferase